MPIPIRAISSGRQAGEGVDHRPDHAHVEHVGLIGIAGCRDLVTK
ncbi:hypothetical protein [Mycobacterium pseudokansasii]|nr:hypothetical protein [Mycobacterium pseudokansasii]